MRARTRTLLAGVVAVAALAGCGSGGSTDAGTTPDAAAREWEVAADPDATAAEIVDAGRPADVAAGAGHTLITWTVESDDDEGPQQGAWRLYDADGGRVADGTLGIVREQGSRIAAHAVAGGFLLEAYTGPLLLHVALDGTVTTVPIRKQPHQVSVGGVIVNDPGGESTLSYDPELRTASPLPDVPTDNPQSIVLDSAGVVRMLLPWSDAGEARVASAPGGLADWRTEPITLDDDSYPILDLAVAGDQVVLMSGHDGTDEYPVLDGLWVRPATPGPASWTKVAPAGITLPRTLSPRVTATEDGRLLVIGDEGPAWIQDGKKFTKVEVPGGDASGLKVIGGDWYLGSSDNRGLQVSHDEGATWEAVPR